MEATRRSQTQQAVEQIVAQLNRNCAGGKQSARPGCSAPAYLSIRFLERFFAKGRIRLQARRTFVPKNEQNNAVASGTSVTCYGCRAPMASPVPDISPRHLFEARVSICVQRGQQELNLQGWVRDLSESGLRAFVADPLLPGESVTFALALSDSVNQVIPAKVMRALGTDYGFQFTALSTEQRHQIQATLREAPELPRPQAGIIWS